MSEAVRVEVLHHEGCPLFASALELVRDCVREEGVDAVISERVARYPSPTVLVDGRDVMGDPRDATDVDACRLDVPTRERVADALRSASSSR
ncbi:alkylmercury lyase [Pseudonocardia petroleophila]|uniref:Alkylmercury lyase n=1 Tax=Pseudonocardia petroleophila TaxID=37331 RepID=A0A7G7ML43_9PSEU|nr:alkylmercury lyase [Pseudonocardia petroleophila]QNG53504.1 alkylmercury lyase [Pseudonocardia petroleophila]